MPHARARWYQTSRQRSFPIPRRPACARHSGMRPRVSPTVGADPQRLRFSLPPVDRGALVEAIPASRVFARIRALITRHHGGDRLAAASQLGLAAEHRERFLNGVWRPFFLDGLAAPVLSYRM